MSGYAVIVAKEDFLRIRVPEGLNEALLKLKADRGLTKQETVERLLRWMLRQDPMTQLLVLGVVPASYESEAANLVLSRMAGVKHKSRVIREDSQGAQSGSQHRRPEAADAGGGKSR